MRRLVALVLAVLLLAALSGCVTLPQEGPVSSGPTPADRTVPGTFDYKPEGPHEGDSPHEIVAGFLDSLRETPLSYSVARTFLTDEGSKHWAPNTRTVVYADGSLDTIVDGDQATVALGASIQLDSRGSWLGDPTRGDGLSFDLHLVREDDEWRITNPPDALVISRTHFDTRFVRHDLHFFDPSAKVLVPEPVYVPAGVESPSLLVSGLLAGPDPRLKSVERTFFPAGTRLELSVPVEDGVADIALSPEILDTDSGQRDLAMAQLAWTLRQVPGIERMRVTVDGTPIDQTTGASARSVSGWSSYDPSVPSANGDLYALSGGDVVVESEGETSVVTTAYSRTPLRSLGVSLDAEHADTRFAAVTRSGRSALTAAAPSADRPARTPREVFAGSDLLRPSYDLFGNLWLLDRTSSGARLVVDGRRTLEAPGITGKDVKAFGLSRDGTRLAAVVGTRVVVARISRSEDGRPTRVLRAEPVPFDDAGGRAVDVGWIDPDTIGVLVRLEPNISQILLASVDGSFALNAGTDLEPLFDRADRLVTWPGVDAPIYVVARTGLLYQVSVSGLWAPADLPTNLAAPTFPG